MPRELEFDFSLYPQQEEFVQSEVKFTGFVSGIGGGKTTAGAIRSLVHGMNTKGTGLIGAPTYPMLRDSTLRTFRAVCGEAIQRFNRSEMRITFINGNEVLLRSTDDPDHLRGPNIAWIWLDEAQLMSEEAWHIIEGRLREGVRRAWATFTPNGKRHWTYRVFGQDSSNHKLFHARTQDNPWLPKDYIAALEASYTGSFAAQELGGEFVEPEGALFSREWFGIIGHDSLPKGLSWVRSWDLALTEDEAGDNRRMRKPDRSASVAVAISNLGNIYIMDGMAFRKEWPEVRQIIIERAKVERIPLIVEAVAFQKAAVQELLREPELMGIEIKPYIPGQLTQPWEPPPLPISQSQAMYVDRGKRDRDRSKVDRARSWQARAANRQIFLVAGAWIDDFLDEVCDFRADMTHPHDDWVDAVSIAMKHLRMPTLFESLHASGKPQGLIFNKAQRGPGRNSQSKNIVFL